MPRYPPPHPAPRSSWTSSGRPAGPKAGGHSVSRLMSANLAHDEAREPLAVQLLGVSRTYGAGASEVRALDGIDFSVASGEFVALMGPSGAGKSTCLNILGCLDRPTSGRYGFRGVDVAGISREQRALLRRHFIGFVFQGFNLLNRTTALENVELPLIYRRVPRKERHERAREMLELVGLAGREHHTPGELSGGQQQRVAIARAMVTNPSLVLADRRATSTRRWASKSCGCWRGSTRTMASRS
jgi:putative ABC transport system ATP-binding protein